MQATANSNNECSTSTSTADTRTPLQKLADSGVVYLTPDDLYRMGLASSKSSLYRRIASGKFPRPVHLDAQSPRWPVDEIISWDLGLRAQRAAVH